MSSGLRALDFRLDYTSSASDVLNEFYVPALNVAEYYDRAVGYFRSSVYHLVGVALSNFALRGGHMRLVCSPSLSESDREVIQQSERELLEESLARDIRDVLLHPEERPVTELLATLLRCGGLEIKIAYRPGSIGIFHLKRGVFTDRHGDQMSFEGSDNETFLAWHEQGNSEGFGVFLSWEGGDREKERVLSHAAYFERLWNNSEAKLQVVPLPEVPAQMLLACANADGLQAAVERARAHIGKVARRTRTPRRRQLPHQAAVERSWWENRRGIIDHVTGAGKTFTALCIIRSWLASGNSTVIVIVPSDLLATQWQAELVSELDDYDLRLLRVGGSGSNPRWQEALAAFCHPANRRGTKVVLATMQSARRPAFLMRVRDARHILLVGDEVHRLGSGEHRKILAGIDAGARLGLSATPRRHLDAVGTASVFDYFGAVLKPPFGIKEAQQAGQLVPYDYYIRSVRLTDAEHESYKALTKRIAQARSTAGTDPQGADRLQRLLIARSRILKGADSKVGEVRRIVDQEFSRTADHRWLIYCDDGDQLRQVMRAVQALGVPVQEYTSTMDAAPRETIRIFERYGGILCAIRCLDEGVDIPAITHAVMLASSINPREHLQRRGRVLRRAPGKYSAVIYDVLIAVADESGDRVFRSELMRARRFAADARNLSVLSAVESLLLRSEEDDGLDFEDDSLQEEDPDGG